MAPCGLKSTGISEKSTPMPGIVPHSIFFQARYSVLTTERPHTPNLSSMALMFLTCPCTASRSCGGMMNRSSSPVYSRQRQDVERHGRGGDGKTRRSRSTIVGWKRRGLRASTGRRSGRDNRRGGPAGGTVSLRWRNRTPGLFCARKARDRAWPPAGGRRGGCQMPKKAVRQVMKSDPPTAMALANISAPSAAFRSIFCPSLSAEAAASAW